MSPSIEPLRINTQLHLGPFDAYEDEEHDDGYISAVGSISAIEQFGSDQTLVGSYDSGHVNHPRSPISPNREGAEDSISLRPPGAPSPMRRRPSLISAIEVKPFEIVPNQFFFFFCHFDCPLTFLFTISHLFLYQFHDVVRSLTLSGSRGRVASYDPSYYGPRSSGLRTPGIHRQHSARSARSHSGSAGGFQIPSPIAGPVLYPGQSSDRSHPTISSPLPLDSDDEQGERSSMDRHQQQHLEENAILHHSLILPNHHDHANQHLGHIHDTQEFSSQSVAPPAGGPSRTILQKFIHGFKTIQPIYFPTLLDWDQKSAFVKFLAITSIPMVLLLTLTLPVVELCEDEIDEDDASVNFNQDSERVPRIVIEGEAEPEHKYDGWSRTATTTQMLLAPVFVATVISSKCQSLFCFEEMR